MKVALNTVVVSALLVHGAGCAVLGQGGKGTISVIYYAPAWGPNTNDEEVVYFLKQVTFQGAATEQSRIYFCSIKPDGTERREIAWLWKDKPDQFLEPFATAAHMEINAATKRAALGIELGERGGIFVFNLDGSDFHSLWPKEWSEDRPTRAGYPTWSPDGQWLAFQEYRFEKGFNLYRVVKCRPDSTEYLPLTERQASNMYPAWSPTANQIAFSHYPKFYPGPRYLWLMDADGSNKRETKVWGSYPRWSPDGKFILNGGEVVLDVTLGKPATEKPAKVWNGHWIYPKWGKNGLVSVGPQDISFTSTERDYSGQLLKNVSRRGHMADIGKEQSRW